MTWWQILLPLMLAVVAVVLYVRHRSGLRRWARRANQELQLEEERLVGSLALAEETVHRILLSAEIETTLSRMTVNCAELLDLAGVRIHLEPEVVQGAAGPGVQAQSGSCEGENTQRLPVRAQNREIGSFWFTPKQDRPLRSRELHFLRLMAILVGIGVENLLFHRQVAAANEEKSRFILATTHDLRSPMTTIEQLTQVMLDGYAGEMSEKQRDLLLKIKGRSNAQLQLIADLLAIAAEENPLAVPRVPESVSLAEIFDAQVEAIRPACESKQITLVSARDEASMIRTAVKGDMENLMGNLLSNAVKYTPPAGQVTFSLRTDGRGYRIKVEDTGIGIPKESLPNLFKEYFRAPNAREMTRHGTGLGLALVQKLVLKYAGKIRVDSRVNEGTMFEIYLPADGDSSGGSVAQGRMKVGGILVTRNLGMLSIIGTPHGPGMAGVVLEALGEAEINVEFISCCPDSSGGDNIVVCVDTGRLTDAFSAVEEVQSRLRPTRIGTTEGLAVVAVYGPHFREIPTVAGQIFRALADAGVNILAISTSISSVASVFDQSMLEAALASLRRRFDVS